MAETHIVEQGEHLSGIATRYGFADYQTIWNHARNAELKKKRQNPNVLLPGDAVFIPDKVQKEASGATGQTHRFRVRRPKLLLRLVVRDFTNQPIADSTCQLEIEGEQHDLRTDANGKIETEVPLTARTGKLTIQDMEFPLLLGHLDPVDEPSGLHARLANLGYYSGSLEEPDAAELRAAIEEFQCDHGLKVDGIVGPQTQAKLKDVHGS